MTPAMRRRFTYACSANGVREHIARLVGRVAIGLPEGDIVANGTAASHTVTVALEALVDELERRMEEEAA